MLSRPGTGKDEIIELNRRGGSCWWWKRETQESCVMLSHFLLKAMVLDTEQPAGVPKEAQGAVP